MGGGGGGVVGKSRKGESSTEFQNCENYNNHGEKKGKLGA